MGGYKGSFNEKKILIIAVVITFFTLVGGSILLASSTSTPKIEVSQNAKAQVSQAKFDWGEINYSGGPVSKTFKIKNSGTDPLKLFNVKTSCACTKAYVKIGNSNSPAFSMHNISSWIGEVAPLKEAELTVIFDPAFHGPSGVGQIDRVIFVETNDSTNAKLEFNLKGNVVKK